MTRNTSTSSIRSRILSRIYGYGRGHVFTPTDFGDIGKRSTVDWALHDLTEAGTIQRIARGLYYYPDMHPELGPLSPSTDSIAKAIERRDGIRLHATGAYAANLLGLSEQVPMKVVFLTDGPSRTIQVGNQKIIMKQTTTKQLAPVGHFSGLLIQSLKSMGKGQIPLSKLEQIAHKLPEKERMRLRTDARYAPAWIASIMRKLSEVTEEPK